MEYKVIDSCEWTYPDVWDYASETDGYKGYALSGSYATFRVIVRGFVSKTISFLMTRILVAINKGKEEKLWHIKVKLNLKNN